MMKRIMHALRLDKIAAVDRPCQEPATMTIIKRADMQVDDGDYPSGILKRKFTAEERKKAEESGAAMPGGRYPIETEEDLHNAVRAVGRGKGSHAKIKAHIKSRAKSLGLTDKLPDSWSVSKILKAARAELRKGGILGDSDGDEGAETFDEIVDQNQLSQQLWDAFYKATDALRQSICSIIKDEAVTDKAAMIAESLDEFADYITEIIPGDIGKSLAAGVATSIAGSAGITLKGEPMFSEAVKKALGLTATATDADVTKAIEDNKKKADEHDKAAKRADAIAKMSDKHKAFMNHPKAELPTGGKEAFADMGAGERDKHIDAHPVEDEEETEKMLKRGDAFKAADGSVLTKRDFGTPAGFAFAKSQSETVIKQSVEIAKANEEKAVASFEKRAVDAGFAKEFGATMRKAYNGDAAAQVEVEKQVVALRKQVETGALFGEFGKSSAQTGTAHAELIAKAEEIRKATPALTKEQAFAKAYTDRGNADIVKRYKVEQRAH